MLIKKLILLYLSLISFSLFAQPSTPYFSYGAQVDLLLGGMYSNTNQLGPYGYTYDTKSDIGFGVLLNANYFPVKWFGLSSGLGVQSLGVSNLKTGENSESKSLYHLKIPILLNFKAGFFTLEAGIDNRIFIGMNSKTEGKAFYSFYQQTLHKEDLLMKEDVKTYYMAGSVGGRFRIFKGFSLNLGFNLSLTDVATHQSVNDPGQTISWNNMNYYAGLRYVFERGI